MNKALLLIPMLLMLAVGCSRSTETPPLEGAAIGGPFTLTGESGKPIKSSSFDGKYRLIYFGYTFCPDVCPVDVQTLMKGYQQFEQTDAERAAKVVPLFITLDPERDTPDVLRQWTDAFDPQLIGLTGSPEQIDAVAKQFAVYFKRDTPDEDGAYLVDHARMSLLMGPKGEPIALIAHDKDAATVAAELDRWVQ
ncbi:MAG: SCO family protein [Sphingomonadaceae bacterium]